MSKAIKLKTLNKGVYKHFDVEQDTRGIGRNVNNGENWILGVSTIKNTFAKSPIKGLVPWSTNTSTKTGSKYERQLMKAFPIIEVANTKEIVNKFPLFKQFLCFYKFQTKTESCLHVKRNDYQNLITEFTKRKNFRYNNRLSCFSCPSEPNFEA